MARTTRGLSRQLLSAGKRLHLGEREHAAPDADIVDGAEPPAIDLLPPDQQRLRVGGQDADRRVDRRVHAIDINGRHVARLCRMSAADAKMDGEEASERTVTTAK